MTNFDLLLEECKNYILDNKENDESEIGKFDEMVPLLWGMTEYESFVKVILSVKKPKRFVVFGCSIGYQCFFWNKIFPDIPCIGIDLVPYRVEWGNSMIKKYLVKNVELVVGDIYDFKASDGDLIWQNNLLFSHQMVEEFNNSMLCRYDIELITFIKLFGSSETGISTFHDVMSINGGEFLDKDFTCMTPQGKIKVIKNTEFFIETNWDPEQNIFYYWKLIDEDLFGVDFINHEFIIPERELKDYDSMNFSKRNVKSDVLKILTNKYYAKLKFIELGFNVPELYHYFNEKYDLSEILKSLKTFAAKPAHFSESVDIFVKKNIYQTVDIDNINSSLNKRIEISDKFNWRKGKIDVEIDWKDTEHGIIVEEYIQVKYELKVFVVFGQPIIGDLRTGPTEFDNLDYIYVHNSYLNWFKEYELIKKLAIELKIDFFRIDFLYDGVKLYASELSFMPGTLLPISIQQLIANRLRLPYLRYYYPQLS